VNDKREENLGDFNDFLSIYQHLSALFSLSALKVLFSAQGWGEQSEPQCTAHESFLMKSNSRHSREGGNPGAYLPAQRAALFYPLQVLLIP
jgi:hypothetical protein